MKRIEFIRYSSVLIGGATAYPLQALARSESARESDSAKELQTPLLNRYKAEMISIPAGTFKMGSDDDSKDEKPAHDVYLSGYRIGKNLVTVGLYEEFCKATERKMPDAPKFNEDWEEKDHPIVNVSWKDAKAFCTWAGGSLPTEAQWEKAARGTDGRKYPWGDQEPNKNRGWFPNLGKSLLDYDREVGTAPVGKFPSGASPYGCLDMAGNVEQWCEDFYGEDYYRDSPRENPTGPAFAQDRVVRGISWVYSFAPFRCSSRLPNRGGNSSRDRFRDLGFRLSSP